MRHDHGQAVFPVAAVVVMAALAVVGMARLADRAVMSARAQLAADAAALAAVHGGPAAAAVTAQRNGVVLVELVDEHGDVAVEVDLDGHRAQARAGR